MKLKKLIVENFKGVRSQEFTFSGVTHIIGENGSGKSTLETAYFWLLADVDSELNSNPNVRPIGADDGIVTKVEGVFDFDGKEVSIVKVQKVKTKTGSDGKTKTTKTNSFEVNGVPKSQRDVAKYLADLGFVEEHFLALSHPNMFLKGMAEKKARTAIRNTLFGMTTELSDKEVAEKSGMVEIAQLLLKHTLEEIVAMQNSTKRRITAEYGRNGEVIDNKIDGLNAGKVEVDLDSATKERDDATVELEAVQKELAELNSSEANAEINSEISKLLEEKRSHLEAVVKEINDSNWKNRGRMSELSMKADALAGRIATAKRNVIDAEYEVQRMDKAVKDEQERYKQVKASKFDESKTVCPTCKRRYSEKKVAEIKENFEDSKARELEKITANGKKYATQRDKSKGQVTEYKLRVAELETELAEAKKQLSEIPADKPLIRDDETTRGIDAKVAELKAKMQLTSDVRKKELIAKSAEIRSRRDSAMKRIVMAENNERIDAQIAELQMKRKEYEQSRLDAERILDEVKQLEMAKNEMLTEQINSHFKLVKWVLFETQANGEILTDRCTPYIDGKSMVDEANTGRVILGKLDIVEGLQNFYGERYPVWLDNAEALTSNTSERIQLDTQLITLSAVDGEKLTVNGGD